MELIPLPSVRSDNASEMIREQCLQNGNYSFTVDVETSSSIPTEERNVSKSQFDFVNCTRLVVEIECRIRLITLSECDNFSNGEYGCANEYEIKKIKSAVVVRVTEENYTFQ